MNRPFTVTPYSPFGQVFFRPDGFSPLREGVIPSDLDILGIPQESIKRVSINNKSSDMAMFQASDKEIPLADSDEGVVASYIRLSNVRGVIVNIATNKIMAPSMSCIMIAFPSSEQQFSEIMTNTIPRCMLYREGCVIRMFYTGERWVKSTSRRIDANNTKIPMSEIKVLELFQSIAPTFNTSMLNTEMVYFFLVVHPQNQILNPDPVEPSIILMGIKDRKEGRLIPSEDSELFNVVGISKPSYIDAPTALDMFKNNKWVMGLNNYGSWIQFGNPNMIQLCKARQIHLAEFHPPRFMWLRLAEQERQILSYAVSNLYREDVLVSTMTAWCEDNIKKLVSICCMLILARSPEFKLRSKRYMEEFITKNDFYCASRKDLEDRLEKNLRLMVATDGIIFYKMCDEYIKFMNRLAVIDILIMEGPEGKYLCRDPKALPRPAPESFSDNVTVKKGNKQSQNHQKKKHKKPNSPPNIKKDHRKAKRANRGEMPFKAPAGRENEMVDLIKSVNEMDI
jgi:hypothetical protein